jgi:hypothetical protein
MGVTAGTMHLYVHPENTDAGYEHTEVRGFGQDHSAAADAIEHT